MRATRARTTGHARRPSTNTIAPVRPTTAGSIAKQVGRTRIICFGSDLTGDVYEIGTLVHCILSERCTF